MPEQTITKTLTVISITTSVEFATGDNLYQVSFGEMINVTQDMLDRLPPPLRQIGIGNQVGVNELVLFMKTQEVPYRVGSQWNFTVNADGSMKLVAR